MLRTQEKDGTNIFVVTESELKEIIENQWKKFNYNDMPSKYMECMVMVSDGKVTRREEDVWLEIEGEWNWQSHFEGVYAPITLAYMEIPKCNIPELD